MRNWLRPQGLFPLLSRGPAAGLGHPSVPRLPKPTAIGLAHRLAGAWQVDRFSLLTVLAGLLLALAAAQTLEARLTDLLLEGAAARAADHVRLDLVPRLSADDFAPPHRPEQLAALERRLEPVVARMREEGSDLIRLRIHAQDGTILYSDNPAMLGQVVPPTGDPLLARALAGSTGTEFSRLLDPDDADVRAQYDQALEVHAPLVLDGQVVGAYHLYELPAVLQQLSVLVWATGAGVFGLVLLLGYRVRRVARWGRDSQVAGASPPPAPVLAAAAEAALTPREREVLALMAANCTYKEIAARLVLGEATVRSHAKSILRKLRQPDRAQAVIAAVRTGLLQLPTSLGTDVTGPLPPDTERGPVGPHPAHVALVSSAGR